MPKCSYCGQCACTHRVQRARILRHPARQIFVNLWFSPLVVKRFANLTPVGDGSVDDVKVFPPLEVGVVEVAVHGHTVYEGRQLFRCAEVVVVNVGTRNGKLDSQ